MIRTFIAASLLLCLVACRVSAGTAFHDPIYGTATTSNITYGTGLINGGSGSLNLKLNLYRPTDIGGGALPSISPGIVLVHGGGFTGGDKNDMAPLAVALSQYGYTVVSINYRLYGNNPPMEPGAFDDINSLPTTPPAPPYQTLPADGLPAVNAAVLDSMKAITWMKTNAATYNIDPNHIALGGVSAGAITSLLEAYIDPTAGTMPQAVLSYSGSMYGAEAAIAGNVPPAFIVHGTADGTVPFAGSQAVANKLTSLGIYNEFYAQPGVGHTTNFNLVTGGETLFEHQIDFLARFLVPEPSSVVLGGFALASLTVLAWRRTARAKSSNATA